jgi:4-amino-4-deoxy-L-arabinose transferase-like glycosyltransferase
MLQPTPNAGSGPPPLIAALMRPAVLPVAVFAWLAATAWLRPLSLPDEGRYVGVALEMLWSGNWLVPTLDTLPYFHKPPLFYWATAASLATFGINEWAARLGSLLAATGCALGVYHFLRRWAGEAQAGLALLVLVTTPFFYGGAQFANLDMLVAACIAGTILSAAHAVLASGEGAPTRPALAAAYAFAALGLLAKGLIGIVIPGMVIGIWLVFIGRPAMLLRLVWLPGLALFSAIALPWFLLMQARYPGFFDYFFVHHHFDRYVTQGFNSRRPFWFSVAVFAGATLPWFVFLAPAIRWRGEAHADGTPGQVRALMWIWLVSTLIFFSIPSSKLLGYVLAAVPPLGGLAAEGLTRVAGTPAKLRVGVMRVVAIAVLIGGAMLTGTILRDGDRDNTRALATRLGPLMTSPADPLVVLNNYPFSLLFYLRRPPPLRVVEDWQDSRVIQKDSWRRELYEAAMFDPPSGKLLLLDAAAMRVLLGCSRQTVWLIASSASAERLPQLAGLERVTQVGNDAVWRKSPSPVSDPNPDCAP